MCNSRNDPWNAATGATFVLVNNRRPHRLYDSTDYCDGGGKLVQGSANVLVGNTGPKGSAVKREHQIRFLLIICGVPIGGAELRFEDAMGQTHARRSDADGLVTIDRLPPGAGQIRD